MRRLRFWMRAVIARRFASFSGSSVPDLKGLGPAASNIGMIYRDEGRPRLAARWFQKAVSLGATDSLFELAKLYLEAFNDPPKARAALIRLLRAKDITEDTREQSEALLQSLRL
jgi:hypothetical protein